MSHSFEQEQAPIAILRMRSGSLNISIATRLGLKRLSVSKVIHFNVQGDPSEFPGSTISLHLQHLGQTPSEGKRRVTEALWRADVRRESASKVILDDS